MRTVLLQIGNEGLRRRPSSMFLKSFSLPHRVSMAIFLMPASHLLRPSTPSSISRLAQLAGMQGSALVLAGRKKKKKKNEQKEGSEQCATGWIVYYRVIARGARSKSYTHRCKTRG